MLNSYVKIIGKSFELPTIIKLLRKQDSKSTMLSSFVNVQSIMQLLLIDT